MLLLRPLSIALEYSHTELYDKLRRIAGACIISPSDSNIINKAFSEIYPDFEDAVQYFSAKSLKADVIVTRNKVDFTMADEKELKTPAEFLDDFFSLSATRL